MSNRTNIDERFRFHPEYFTDPVPEYLLEHFRPEILRELTLISLERAKAIQEVNGRYIAGVIASVTKAKF